MSFRLDFFIAGEHQHSIPFDVADLRDLETCAIRVVDELGEHLLESNLPVSTPLFYRDYEGDLVQGSNEVEFFKIIFVDKASGSLTATRLRIYAGMTRAEVVNSVKEEEIFEEAVSPVQRENLVERRPRGFNSAFGGGLETKRSKETFKEQRRGSFGRRDTGGFAPLWCDVEDNLELELLLDDDEDSAEPPRRGGFGRRTEPAGGFAHRHHGFGKRCRRHEAAPRPLHTSAFSRPREDGWPSRQGFGGQTDPFDFGCTGFGRRPRETHSGFGFSRVPTNDEDEPGFSGFGRPLTAPFPDPSLQRPHFLPFHSSRENKGNHQTGFGISWPLRFENKTKKEAMKKEEDKEPKPTTTQETPKSSPNEAKSGDVDSMVRSMDALLVTPVVEKKKETRKSRPSRIAVYDETLVVYLGDVAERLVLSKTFKLANLDSTDSGPLSLVLVSASSGVEAMRQKGEQSLRGGSRLVLTVGLSVPTSFVGDVFAKFELRDEKQKKRGVALHFAAYINDQGNLVQNPLHGVEGEDEADSEVQTPVASDVLALDGDWDSTDDLVVLSH